MSSNDFQYILKSIDKIILLTIRLEIINFAPFCSMALQPSHPIPGILQFSNPWISVLPEGEGFLVVLDGFGYSFIS